jgi:hypothetical protein
MPVPSTNTKLSDIQTTFGGSNPIQISEYYAGGSFVPATAPAPNGPIPSSGQISIGQFRAADNPVTFEYLVIAGGGGGGAWTGGGGGAGGYLTTFPGGATINLGAGTYPITVGAGGAGGPNGEPSPASINSDGQQGSPSIFTNPVSTITSTGGGFGNGYYQPGVAPTGNVGGPGGSGGGGGGRDPGGGQAPGGSGVPGQGNPGGACVPNFYGGGGGGGAGATGQNGPGGQTGGAGGAGLANSITGSPVTRAGGGGGAVGGSGGSGGGAPAGAPGTPGTAGTGGGGGGGRSQPGSGGGSGIVVLRAPSSSTFSVAPGTNTVTTAPTGQKIATFTVSGTLTI